MLVLLDLTVHRALSPFVPMYFIFAWVFSFLLARSIWFVVQEVTNQAARMHQVPCANCQFFTNNYALKCTVHPETAMSEAAIDCPDYQSAIYSSKLPSERQNSTCEAEYSTAFSKKN